MQDNNQVQNPKFEKPDDMKPLKDYLLGVTSTVEFVEKCREIKKTEDAEFEIIQPKQLNPAATGSGNNLFTD